jgi:hypothetical protein
LISKLYVAVDRLPAKGNLFVELFSFMRNLAENIVDTIQSMFLDESVVCPVQNYITIMNAFLILPFIR